MSTGTVLVFLAAGALAAHPAPQPSSPVRPIAEQSGEPAPASIGTATMLADGTIVLYLIARGPGGIVGHGQLTYPPDHPQYAEVLRHLGGLRPGETRSVPPWPDR